MSIIYPSQKASKGKRKPGWAKAQADYEKWLHGVKTMSSGIKPTSKLVFNKKVKPETPEQQEARRARYVVGTAGKPVVRPEILYRDDPEMLARELKARERKFNSAPAYNKGGSVYISEEELTAVLSSNKRRP